MSTVNYDASLVMSLDDHRGMSAYEIAVKNGFEGSETEWLASLKGEDGRTHTVNGVEELDGNILLTGEDIPLSPSDNRTLPQLASGMDAILGVMNVTAEGIDLGQRYIDNALFR